MSSPSVSDYLFVKIIGLGSNATVFKAVRKDEPEEMLAIKCINVSKLSESTIDKIVEESNLIKLLEHENIVKLKEFFINESRIYFVMEYCDGGSFSTILSTHCQFNPSSCQKFLQELGSALQYLHNHNISHMNLKPENLLLVTRPYVTLKVGDYGFAPHLSHNEYILNIHGSPLYKAPEILLNEQFDSRVDLWSIGVMMYEWLFGKSPYYGLISDLTLKIKQCHQIEIPQVPRISNACKHLLTSLLQRDLNYRLTFEDFFSDEFLDLKHRPCEENFIKAQKLIQDAVGLEFKNKLREAFDLYSEALKYFIPMLKSNHFRDRRRNMKLFVHDLIYCMEDIRLQLRDDNLENTSERPRELTKPPIYYNLVPKRLTWVLRGTLGYSYKKLRSLSKNSPEIYAALDLGGAGVFHLSEGHYTRATELLQRALDELIPILRNEPIGMRRHLLKNQVDFWNKLHIAAVSHFTLTDIYTRLAVKSREFCILQ